MPKSIPHTVEITPADQAFRGRSDLSVYGDNARLLFALQLRFEIEDIDSVATTALVDAPDDKKCDVVYLDRDRATLVVAQGYECPNTARESAKANKASDLNAAVTWLFAREITALPESLQSVAYEVRTAIGNGDVDVVEFWYVHNLPESENVRQELLTVEQTVRNTLNGGGFNLDKIPKQVIATEVGRSTQDEWYKALSAHVLVADEIAFDVPGAFSVRGDNWEAVVTAVRADALYALYRQHGDALFSANYRDYLGNRRRTGRAESINAQIQHSAVDEPLRFWVYNNGVSAIVNGFDVKHNGSGTQQFVAKGMSIVNGAQTTGSLGSLPTAPPTDAMVPIRFIRCNDAQTVSDIVRFNNSQNPLLPADFKSNDSVQRRLREEFKSIPRCSYTGGRRGIPMDRLAALGANLPADTCAQALAAFHQYPEIAYHRKADIWNKDEVYQQFFAAQTKARHVLFAYALLKVIEAKKQQLRAASQSSTALTESQQKQFDFLCLRGAPLLLVAAISRSLEAILGQPIVNRFTLAFDTAIEPSQAIGHWTPIVESTIAFCPQLKNCADSGVREHRQIEQAVGLFVQQVEATKAVLSPTFATFAAEVKRL